MIIGSLVRLRAVESGDMETVSRWHNDAEAMRWMDHRYPESVARTIKRFEDHHNTFGSTILAIEPLAEPRLIGLVAMHGAEPETGAADIDIYLGDRDAWGHGYATDAMRTACRFGFEEMRLHRIALTVAAENTAAQRVYEKVGFVVEGRDRESFRRAGQWHDMIRMGILDGELRP